MASITQFFLAAPTTPPLVLGLNPGFTRLHAARPGLLTAVGNLLNRLISLSTTASTRGFNWLSLGNFPRRRLNLHPTPTSPYHLEPTKTFPVAANRSLAIIAIPLLICLFSLLFGAAVANGRRRGSSSSPFTVSRQKKPRTETPSPKSSYSESPTLFHQDDTVLPSHLPRPSSFCTSAREFGLRGLAFLFRLICMEKLLDMVEDNSTKGGSATSADNAIAELRALNKKLTNIAMPMQTVVFSARLPDANQTLVAPFLPLHAKSKPGHHDSVDVPLPDHIKAPPPTSIEIESASTRRSSLSPPGEEVFAMSDPPAVAGAGATYDGGGEGRLPTSYHRSSSRIRLTSSPEPLLASFPVEPQGVPDIPPSHEFSNMPFKPNPLADDHPAVSPSVEPSGVPDGCAAALEPQAGSSGQAKTRPISSPQRPRHSKSSTSSVDIATKRHQPSVYQLEVRRLFQSAFDDLLPNGSKPTTPISSVRLPDPTSKTDAGRRTDSVEQGHAESSTQAEVRPTRRLDSSQHSKSSTSKPLTPSVYQLEVRRLFQSAFDDLLPNESKPTTPTSSVRLPDPTTSKTDTGHRTSDSAEQEGCPKRPRKDTLTSASQKDRSEMDTDTLRSILLSSRSSTIAEENRSRFASVEAMRDNARKVIGRARESAAAFDLRMQTKHPEQFSTAGTVESPLESVDEIREKTRRVIQRSQEAVAALDLRIRTKYPARESSRPGEQPRIRRPKPKSTDAGSVT